MASGSQTEQTQGQEQEALVDAIDGFDFVGRNGHLHVVARLTRAYRVVVVNYVVALTATKSFVELARC